MFPSFGVYKRKTDSPHFLLLIGVLVLGSFLLSGCDVRGDAWKNGPVKIADVQKQKEEMKNEVSRMEKPEKVESTSTSSTQQVVRNPDSRRLNPKNLFSNNLRTDRERIDRLERAMQNLRNDFDLVEPSIKRLMAIEADIQNLVGELRKLSNETTQARNNAPPPVAEPPKPAAPVKKAAVKKSVQTKTPPALKGNPEVYDVRIGEHSDKTRVVLDVNGKSSYSVDIDNNENILVVDLPNTGWSAPLSKNIRSKIISSYSADVADDGVILVFQLKRNARILSQDDIPGARGTGRRIVIDLR